MNKKHDCNCGKPKCDDHCGISPAVLQINNPSECVYFHRVEVPASMGDSKTNPPKSGAYKNVLLYYEADQTSWLYSSDGVPQKLVNGITNYEDAINLPQINGVTLLGNKSLGDLGITDAIDDELLSRAVVFDTVADMKSSTDLIDGSYAQTLGFHTLNDGGGATYKIRTIGESETADEMFTIAIGDTLIAELIINDELIVNTCGIYGDNTHDDYAKLNILLGKAKLKNLKVKFNSSSTYLISAPLNVANLDIDFNYATIKVYGNSTIANVLNVDSTAYYTTLRNLNIDATNASVGLDLIQARKCYINNVNITNISDKGVRQTGGYECKLTHFNLSGDGTSHCYGIYAYGHDNTYDDFVMIDCYTAIYNRGLNFYNDIHAWLSNADLFYHSCFLDVDTGQLLSTNMYCDTYHWCIASESNISEIVVNNLFLATHEDYATSESSQGEPVALHYSKADGYNARMINIKNSIISASTIGLVWNTDSTGNQINYCGVLEARFPSIATYYLQGIPCSPVVNIPATLTKTNEFTNINMDSIDINWFYKVAEAKNSYSFTLPFIVNECRLPVFKSVQWDGEEPIGMAYFNNNSCTITITGGSSSITTSNYLHIVGSLPRIYRANS